MRWLPWVSREHHTDVVAAKDRLIASLEAQNAVLAERLAEPVAVTVTLPKDFAVLQPAVVQRPATRGKKRADAAEPVNYADMDETNHAQLAATVITQLGSRAKTANNWERRQILSSLIIQIRAAKAARLRDQINAEVGWMEGSTAPSAQPPAAAQHQDVPLHIRELIEQAEEVG